MLLASAAASRPRRSRRARLRPIATADALAEAARMLLPHLERGQRIDATALRAAMEAAFGGSDADGAWDWKTAYDACEAATVLFLRKFGPAMRARAGVAGRHARRCWRRSPACSRPTRAAPRRARRFSNSRRRSRSASPPAPPPRSRPPIVVLEPSAGTGLLAILAELAGALARPERTRRDPRRRCSAISFPASPSRATTPRRSTIISTPASRPSVVLMNPPFSAAAHVDGRMADAALRHIASALARLAEGGRLVAITGANFAPDNPAWRDAFVRLQERGRVVFSAAIDGAVYAQHGTTIETRLTVIDRVPADDPTAFPASPGMAPDVATLLGWVDASTFRRALPIATPSLPRASRRARRSSARTVAPASPRVRRRPSGDPNPRRVELAYETVDWTPAEGGRITEALYEGYALQSIRIPGAQAASDQARAIGGDGLGRAAQAVLPAASAGERRRRRPAVRRPARKRHLCRRGPCRLSRRLLDGRRDLRRRLGRARRCRERRPLPPRLVSRRRHRRRQGPPGRRHPARQLAEGPPPRGLDLASPTS